MQLDHFLKYIRANLPFFVSRAVFVEHQRHLVTEYFGGLADSFLKFPVLKSMQRVVVHEVLEWTLRWKVVLEPMQDLMFIECSSIRSACMVQGGVVVFSVRFHLREIQNEV